MLSPDAEMIDRRILQEAATLQRAGHRVTILSGFACEHPDASETGEGVVVKRYVYDWVDRRRVRDWPWLPLVAWQAVRMLYRFADTPEPLDLFILEKALEHGFDVVHAHDFPVLRAAVLAARERDVPVVYDTHEFYPVQSVLPKRVQRRYLALERRLMRECRQVITVNPYLARMMARVHGVPEPLVLLNAAPLPDGDTDDAALVRAIPGALQQKRSEAGLPGDRFLFLFQGWLSRERNLMAMLEAMPSVDPRAHLVVVGYGAYLDDMRAAARRLGIERRVTFTGRVENDALRRITPLADVGLIPYAAVDEMHRYCSPNKLYEFIVAGLPIIANDLPYLRDVVAGYGLGWLGAIESPEVLAALMNEAMRDRAELEAKRANALSARERINWAAEGAKLVALYDQIEQERRVRRTLGAPIAAAGRQA